MGTTDLSGPYRKWQGKARVERADQSLRFPVAAARIHLIGIIRCWYGVPAHIT